MRFQNLAVFFFCSALLALAIFAPRAEASGNDVICQVSFTTAVKGETFRNALCVWAPGTVLTMQCDQDVYYSGTSPVPGSVGPDAGTTDFKAGFVANSDPIILPLLNTQKDITVLGVSASGTCKFGKLSRLR